jgi:hypothetical protein
LNRRLQQLGAAAVGQVNGAWNVPSIILNAVLIIVSVALGIYNHTCKLEAEALAELATKQLNAESAALIQELEQSRILRRQVLECSNNWRKLSQALNGYRTICTRHRIEVVEDLPAGVVLELAK